MRRSRRLAMAALLLAAPARAELRVVATIEPAAMLVRELAASRASVAVLVPPGASPHSFEPQPSDLAALAGAGLLVEVGGELDAWVRALLSVASPAPPRATLLESPGLDRLPASHGHADAADGASHRFDPHVWLDPLRVRDSVLPALAARLAAADAADAAGYAARLAEAQARCTALDAEIRSTLAGRGRRFVAFHAAWRYFAERYALEEVGVIEEAPGEEPTPRELAGLVARARAARVPAILVEPQLSPRIAETLAAEIGAKTVVVDPNGDPTDPARDTYPELLRWNARAFATALGAAP
jgi:ABC-type Zn uptake system ZnuABC Zn-binding protein ZnuA